LAIPVLLILAVLWAAVLIPPLFKARTDRRRGDSIGDFSFRLGVIGRTGGFAPPRAAVPPPRPAAVPTAPRRLAAAPAPLAGPPVMSPAQRRRRDVLLVLGVAVLVTLVAALLTRSTLAWGVQGLADLLFVTYVVLLVRMRTVAAEQRAKVRYLPQHPPQLALRRTASS
jgi:hypothetical protein